jgi:hypothetical protein
MKEMFDKNTLFLYNKFKNRGGRNHITPQFNPDECRALSVT